MKSNDIFLINYTGKKGGGALDAIGITKGLIYNGYQVIAVVSKQLENLNEWHKIPLVKLIEIETYTSKWDFIKKTLLFNYTTKRIIKNELKGIDFSCIICPMITLWTKKINRIFKSKKIIIVNHDPTPHSGASRIIASYYEKQYQKADLVIVHSTKFLEEARKRYRRTEYLPLGQHDIYKNTSNPKKLIDYSPQKVNFLFFGRIEPYKGIDILLKAYQNLKENDKTTLSIIGNGDISPYQTELARTKNVKIVNRWILDEEVGSCFSGKNIVLVCPYKDATQSGPILVAYEYGIPVIATRTGGLDEQVDDGKSGILITPNSVEELTDAMKRFMDSPDMMREMSNYILSFYKKKFNWNNTAKILLEYIKTI